MINQSLVACAAALDPPSLAAEFRRAAAFIPSGVAVIFTPDVAMTVSSLLGVSFDPPLVSVSLSKDSTKARAILEAGDFRVRLLRAGEEAIAKDANVPENAGLVEVECAIAYKFEVGDHNLVIASVVSTKMFHGYPMVYWRRGLHGLHPQYDFLASRAAFCEFVESWEALTLPKSRWMHAAHVAIAACYAVRYSTAAFERTKLGIIRYNEATATENSATSGYHETLTRLWAEVLGRFVRGIADPWTAACAAVEKFGEDRDLHHLYYSFDVVRSTEARRTWIPPDLAGPF